MNYELFSNLVKVAKEKHLPIKRVKYNKRKHKKSKWITTALLNSINIKDRLYKIMIQSDWQDITFYNELKSQYKRYRAVLRKSIREAKRLYHIRMFDTFKNDIKKTWSFINNSLNRNNKKINSTEFNVNDQTITDENHIAEEFNNYFINIGNKLAEKIMATKNFNEYLNRHYFIFTL